MRNLEKEFPNKAARKVEESILIKRIKLVEDKTQEYFEKLKSEDEQFKIFCKSICCHKLKD